MQKQPKKPAVLMELLHCFKLSKGGSTAAAVNKKS